MSVLLFYHHEHIHDIYFVALHIQYGLITLYIILIHEAKIISFMKKYPNLIL